MPIILKYPLLSTKKVYADRFCNALTNNLYSHELPLLAEFVPADPYKIKSREGFSAWIIGYLNYMGSYNNFQLKWELSGMDKNLLLAIGLYFGGGGVSQPTVNKKKTEGYKLVIGGKDDVMSFVKVLHKNPIKFVGNRLDKHLAFLDLLRKSKKYSKYKIPKYVSNK